MVLGIEQFEAMRAAVAEQAPDSPEDRWELWKTAERLAGETCTPGDRDKAQAAQNAYERACDAAGRRSKQEAQQASKRALKALDRGRIDAMLASEGDDLEREIPRLKTGWRRVDDALGGGFEIPSLNVLGAAPKSGKSTWAQIIAAQHAARGGVVLYFDLENGRRRFLRRMLCRRAGLGTKQVARAKQEFESGHLVGDWQKWQEAKRHVGQTIGAQFFLETDGERARDLEASVTAIREVTGGAPLLVVIDSLQRLPMDKEDRRAGVDEWIDRLERVRNLRATVLVISEIKRSKEGRYEASETAFKESSRIEYAADLAMTMTRPSADEDIHAPAVLRVELARECDLDPRGDIAAYRSVYPSYGMSEEDPPPPEEKKTKTKKAEQPNQDQRPKRDLSRVKG